MSFPPLLKNDEGDFFFASKMSFDDEDDDERESLSETENENSLVEE